MVEDGLASNAPHIADLKALKMRYLLGAKPGDHAHLFKQVVTAGDEDRIDTVSSRLIQKDVGLKNPSLVQSETQYVADLALNASNQDVRVNFLQHFEYDNEHDNKGGKVTNRFSWVTDIDLDRSSLLKFVRAGRSR